MFICNQKKTAINISYCYITQRKYYLIICRIIRRDFLEMLGDAKRNYFIYEHNTIRDYQPARLINSRDFLVDIRTAVKPIFINQRIFFFAYIAIFINNKSYFFTMDLLIILKSNIYIQLRVLNFSPIKYILVVIFQFIKQSLKNQYRKYIVFLMHKSRKIYIYILLINSQYIIIFH